MDAKAQQAYELYCQKYARDRGISVDEAKQHAVVREYKQCKSDECARVSTSKRFF